MARIKRTYTKIIADPCAKWRGIPPINGPQDVHCLFDSIRDYVKELMTKNQLLVEEQQFARRIIDMQKILFSANTITDLLKILHKEFNIVGAVEYEVRKDTADHFVVHAVEEFGNISSRSYKDPYIFMEAPALNSKRWAMWDTINAHTVNYINNPEQKYAEQDTVLLIPIDAHDKNSLLKKVYKIEFTQPPSELDKFHQYLSEMLRAAFIRIEALKQPLAERRYYENIVSALNDLDLLFNDQGIVNHDNALILLKKIQETFGFSEIALYRFDRHMGQLDEFADSIECLGQLNYPTVKVGDHFRPKGVKKDFLIQCVNGHLDAEHKQHIKNKDEYWLKHLGRRIMFIIDHWSAYKGGTLDANGRPSIASENAEQFHDDITINYAQGMITRSKLQKYIRRNKQLMDRLFRNAPDEALVPRSALRDRAEFDALIGEYKIPAKAKDALFNRIMRSQNLPPKLFDQMGFIPIYSDDDHIDFLMVRNLRESIEKQKQVPLVPEPRTSQDFFFKEALKLFISHYTMKVREIHYREQLNLLKPVAAGRMATESHELKNMVGTGKKSGDRALSRLFKLNTILLDPGLSTQDRENIALNMGRINAFMNEHGNAAAEVLEQGAIMDLCIPVVSSPDLFELINKLNFIAQYDKFYFDPEKSMFHLNGGRSFMLVEEYNHLKKVLLNNNDQKWIDYLFLYSVIFDNSVQSKKQLFSAEQRLIYNMNNSELLLQGINSSNATEHDLINIIQHVANETEFNQNYIDISVDLSLGQQKKQTCTIVGDEELSVYLFRNLLHNATKGIQVLRNEGYVQKTDLPAEIINDHELMSICFEDPHKMILSPKEFNFMKLSTTHAHYITTVIKPLVDASKQQVHHERFSIVLRARLEEPKSRLTNKKFLIIEVEDNGCGMSDARLQHVNEKLFSKTDQVTTDARFIRSGTGSTGFGLKDGMKFVRSLGGTFEPLTSEEKEINGKWQNITSVRFMIPVNRKKRQG